LFSHKVLRRLVVFPLVVLFISSILLWQQGLFYQLTLVGQIAIYGLAGAGLLLAESEWGSFKLFSLPYYFCLVNGACLLAVWNVIRGHRIVRWNTIREESEEMAVVVQPVNSLKKGNLT
jgi:hypothetical protein